jgi:hypothetical protein
MYKKITFLLLITIFSSCKNTDTDDSDRNEKTKSKQAHWLIGSWGLNQQMGFSQKIGKLNDSTYQGRILLHKRNRHPAL